MVTDDKTENAASAAVVSLRKALGMTQQVFAGEVMKTAVTTIARWETSNPSPRGGALARLSTVAYEHGQPALAGLFNRLYTEEFLENLRFKMLASYDPEDPDPHGYVILKFDGLREIPLAVEFLRNAAKDLTRMKGKGKN